ncbi:ferredoxin [Streptomyces sp. NPDC020898]|uniref:ferredoxin n=1 Tax=Streptomyces sp. NPDC020898 TaxID=3365101 RepID=UPI00379ED8F1
MHVSVDPIRCCAAGQCVLIAPDVFDQADDGSVVVLLSSPGSDRHGAVQEAASVCPGMAIQVEG